MTRLVVGLLTTIALTLLGMHTAYADHCFNNITGEDHGHDCRYLQEDGHMQVPSQSGTENYNAIVWENSLEPLRWTLDDPQGLIGNHVTNAIAAWTSDARLNGLKWQYTSNPAEANLFFHASTRCPACYGEFYWDDDQVYGVAKEAKSWLRVHIYFNNGFNWSSDKARDLALMHEIGHTFGLHERYYNSYWADPVGEKQTQCIGRGPNEYEYTIMDTAEVRPPLFGSFYHCDEPNIQGPMSLDVGRVLDYWGEGSLADLTGTMDLYNRSQANFTWKDYAWAEERQWMRFYFWDTRTRTWVQLAQSGSLYERAIMSRIGVHYAAERPGRTLSTSLQTGSFNNFPSGGAYVRACGEPYFIALNKRGFTTCSVRPGEEPGVVYIY